MRRFAGALCVLLLLVAAEGTRLVGTFDYRDVPAEEPIVFLAKYGVVKGQPLKMYGSAEVTDYNGGNRYSSVYLAFVPSEMWDKIKKAGDKHKLSTKACNYTYYELFGSPCTTHVTDDGSYIRTMPCKDHKDNIGGLCYQPLHHPPPPGNKFLYQHDEVQLTQFWFSFFILCSQNLSTVNHTESCDWKESNRVDFTYNYSIISNKNYNHPNQVPANLRGLFQFYAVFTGLYLVLIFIHFCFYSPLCKKKEQKIHLLVWLYTGAMVLEALNITCGLIHYALFHHDGIGVPPLLYVKDGFNIVSNWILIIILVLVAGGWQVTLRNVKWKCASFLVCTIYIVFAAGYFIGDVVYLYVYPWSTLDPLQQWPGILYLVARSLIVFYVWYQIYHIYRQEEEIGKLRLYRIMAVVFTIWFWYLPLLIILSPAINPVFMTITVTIVTTVMNYFVNIILVFLFCPKWSGDYFQFDKDKDYIVIKGGELKSMRAI